MSQSSDFCLKVYLPSKSPAIRALFAGTYGLPGVMLDDRVNRAKALSAAGDIVDPNIDADAGDPFSVMERRALYGYINFPDMSQGSNVDPVSGKQIYYDPSYRIKVSVDPIDYPPYSGPQPVGVLYVGQYAGNGLYTVINGAESKFNNGDPWTENGLAYTFQTTVIPGYDFWRLVR